MNASLDDTALRREPAPQQGALNLGELAIAQWPAPAALLKPDLRVAMINVLAAAQVGVTQEQAVGRDWFAVNPLASKSALHYHRALRGERVCFTGPVLTGESKANHAETILQPLTQGGRVAGLLVTQRAFTVETNTGESDDSRRSTMLQAMGESGADIMFAIDASGRVIFASGLLRTETGVEPSAVVGRNAFERVHPDDHAEGRMRFASGEVAENPLPMRRARFRFLDAQGVWRWFDSVAINCLSDPILAAVIVYARDASADVAAEAVLEQRERWFQALTEKSDDLILVIGRNGRLLFKSASVARLLGTEPERLDTTAILRHVVRIERRALLRVVSSALSAAVTEHRAEFRVRDAAGSIRWIEAMLVDLSDDSAIGGLLVNARDVTAGRLAETERQAVLQQASVFVWEQSLSTRDIRYLSHWPLPERLGRLAHSHSEADWLEAIHEDDRARVADAYARLESGAETSISMEYRLRVADGSWMRWLERSHIADFDSRGCPSLLRGVCIDVSEQRRVAEALAESRERFSLALECAQIGFYEQDLDADTVIGLNPWCAAVGLPQHDGRPGHGSRWESQIHPEDLAEVIQVRARHTAAATEFAECEYRLRAADGRWRWIFDRSQITARRRDGTPQRAAGVLFDVDNRKRAERALHDSEARLSTAVWGAGVGLWEMDTQTQIARWFSNWCETEGFESCEGPDHVAIWDAQIHPADLGRAAALFADLLEGRCEVYESEYRLRTRSGEWRWIFERSRAIERGPDGRPRRVAGICVNVHARKTAELELRESQFRLRTIAEHTSARLQLFDTDHRLVFSNHRALGVESGEVTGVTADEMVAPEERERFAHFLDEAMTSGTPADMEQQVGVDQQGRPCYLLVRGRPVHANGVVVGAVVTATDISERHRQEQLLRLQARIVETMREGVVLVDLANRIRLTNPAFEQMFRETAAELAGGCIEPLFRGFSERLQSGAQQMARQIAGASGEPVEIECQRPDGSTFTALCVVTPLIIDGAEHWLAVLNDITDRKLLEREILEVSHREQQRIGNDLHDGLGQELTGVALMLRSLATRIRRQHPDSTPEIDEIVALVNQSIQNARTIAHGLSPVALERGELLPALRSLAARTRDTHSLDVSLRTRVAAPLMLDEGAANHLYRIVQEALNNAARHGRATRVRIQVSVDQQTIRVSVHDNGRGLPADGPGHRGLGLRTMEYRATVIGGELTVSNHRQGGMIVRCLCPQGARESVSLQYAKARAHARAHGQFGLLSSRSPLR